MKYPLPESVQDKIELIRSLNEASAINRLIASENRHALMAAEILNGDRR